MILSKDVLLDIRLPEFIRHHYIFLAFTKFYKVFPNLKLENYIEPITSAIKSKGFTIHHSYDETLEEVFRQPEASFIKDVGRFMWSFPKALLNNVLEKIDGKFFAKENSTWNVVFSSDDKKGIWDLATMSQRGILSCQSWRSRKASCLVGSIVDPCCGIIYLASPNGEKMHYRAIVRYIVHKQIGPCLLLERLYPSVSDALTRDTIFSIFARSLTARSKLPVYASEYIKNIPGRCYIPTSDVINALITDRSYCDSGIEYKPIRFSDLTRFKELKDFQHNFGG